MEGYSRRFFFLSDDAGGAAPIVENAPPQVEEFHKDIGELEGNLEETIKDASQAAADAPSQAEHEVMSNLSSALTLLHAELKRANDQREFTQKQVTETVAAANDAGPPVADVVPEAPSVRKVRRGARKVTKK